MSSVAAIINPQRVKVDSELLIPTVGTRYLLTDNIGDVGNVEGSQIWNELVANANDIIEYVAPNRWRVVFAAATETDIEYVTNITTGIQYEWSGAEWIKSYQGVYPGGTWSLVL